ncbi:unnamed protein product, partial [Porites evermanni]
LSCVQPFVVPVRRSQQFKRVFDVIDAKIYVRPLSVYYNYERDPEILQIFIVKNHNSWYCTSFLSDIRITPSSNTLSLRLQLFTPFCWEHSPDANCYFLHDPCPPGLEDCRKSYVCPVVLLGTSFEQGQLLLPP